MATVVSIIRFQPADGIAVTHAQGRLGRSLE
jgi:hypothetical protein